MEIIKVQDYDELSRRAADMVVNQIQQKPDSVLGLATGETPIGMYKNLVDRYCSESIDFSKVRTFNLDEYYPISKNNPQSYYSYMGNHFFKKVNIPIENINIPNGDTEDVNKECKYYEEKIRACGSIDLQVLGIGSNGHIGFNEPDIKFKALTHLVKLDNHTIKDNSRFFNSIEDVPEYAISMGIKTIMQAKKILLLASGEQKKEAVFQCIKGMITPKYPASILQMHPHVALIVDEAAAELI